MHVRVCVCVYEESRKTDGRDNDKVTDHDDDCCARNVNKWYFLVSMNGRSLLPACHGKNISLGGGGCRDGIET